MFNKDRSITSYTSGVQEGEYLHKDAYSWQTGTLYFTVKKKCKIVASGTTYGPTTTNYNVGDTFNVSADITHLFLIYK